MSLPLGSPQGPLSPNRSFSKPPRVNNRIRCTSWASNFQRRRTNRDRQRVADPHVVDGSACLCFSKDGSWFKGNVVDAQGSIYKLSGKLYPSEVIFYEDEVMTDAKSGGSADESREVCWSCSSACLSSLSTSMSGIDGFDGSTPRKIGKTHHPEVASPAESSCSIGSDCLDSELVRKAIESLDLEDGDTVSSGTSRSSSVCGCTGHQRPQGARYKVTMTDFDTGMSYSMKNIYVRRRNSSECAINSDESDFQIKFESKQSYKGISADLLVSRHLGPSFADMEVKAFAGAIRLKYKDPVFVAIDREKPLLYL